MTESLNTAWVCTHRFGPTESKGVQRSLRAFHNFQHTQALTASLGEAAALCIKAQVPPRTCPSHTQNPTRLQLTVPVSS